ncbi:hypothetical protein [Allorhodopirellula solitaria]|uniref:Nickel uptake substrate-specific transmembrane region n=1 Tax=Allorhodopirellula solitaria TaxID=2527987 RepID=A0A5C5YJC4_9BACT|nr:hypothetical protein [Allorhodopirellula solitaria]TWT74978.1 hypothetical protein CA85_02660 [Allorhodopirellula solitaria]
MQKTNRTWAGAVAIALTLTFSFTGCGDSRPEGMPETYPTTLALTQAGEPLADATVVLYPEDSTLTRWPVGGVTDEQGEATLMTSTQYPGAPAGTFKVIVTKSVTEGDPLPKHPGQGATREQINEYDRAMKTGKFEVFKVIAKEYRTAGTTPLTVEVVSSGENTFSEDLGAAVKEIDKQASATAGGDEDYVPMGGNPE